MIDHTGLQISDPTKSRAFYDSALSPLGYKMMVQIPIEHTHGAAVFGYGVPPKADFWVHQGTPNDPKVHVAFRAATHKQVEQFFEAALAAGGTSNGGPGPRPHYHKDYYGAFVLDPDGHNIEVVCHEPT
jgi:catechol 2,3-dioxygenase-like lactoylglutathione lyase family enzyme